MTIHARILEFPYQLKTGEELEGCCDMDVMASHVRLWAVKHLNAIYFGQLKPTPEVVQKLVNMNQSLEDLGHLPLPLNFDH